MTTAFAVVPHGVIGNTAVFGTAILGSSPGGEAFLLPLLPVKTLVGGDFLVFSLRWFWVVLGGFLSCMSWNCMAVLAAAARHLDTPIYPPKMKCPEFCS